MFVELTDDELQQWVKDHDKVMVQYGATWCGNCKIMKPEFKRMAEENESIAFLYVDAEKFPNSRQLAKVDNLPTFAGFVNGELVHQTQGNKIETIQEVKDAITAH